MHPALARTRQGLLAIRAGFGAAPSLPHEIDALLTPVQRSAWQALPAVERAHLSRVAGRLVAEGYRDPDLLTAAAFHDIGKHDATASVRLPHRVARVLGERLAPPLLDRLRHRPEPPRLLRPLWLSVHHARLGADRARACGCSARTCWLIAHHEDAPPVHDPDLKMLQWADDQS